MVRLLLLIGSLFLLVPTLTSPSRAQHAPTKGQRFALLIGNWDYDQNGTFNDDPTVTGALTDLVNSCNDVEQVGAALVKAGWPDEEVEVSCNTETSAMQAKINRFIARVRSTPNATALLYYAGHAVQVDARSYLFGVDARVDLEEEAKEYAADRRRQIFVKDALDLDDDIVGRIGRILKGKTVLIVLDMCRDNALLAKLRDMQDIRSPSDPRDIPSMPGVVIAYSTSPGRYAFDGVGANSLYAAAWAERIKPNVRVDEVISAVTIDVAQKTYGSALEQTPDRRGSFPPPPPPSCFYGCDDPSSPKVPEEVHPNPPRLQRGALTIPPSALALIPTNFVPIRDGNPLLLVQKRAAAPGQPESASAPDVSYYEPSPVPQAAQSRTSAMTVDVFWCDGDSLAEQRQSVAREIAASITAAGRIKPPDGGQLGAVSIRRLPKNVNRGPEYHLSSDIIRFAGGDSLSTSWADLIKSASLPPLGLEPVRDASRSYTAVFVCHKVQRVSSELRVFFQIPDGTLAERARGLSSELQKAMPELAVATEPDVQPSRSPLSTEVRYFDSQLDKEANAVAQRLSVQLGQSVPAKRVNLGGAGQQLEVWLGKNLVGPSPQANQSRTGFIFVGNIGTGDVLKTPTLLSPGNKPLLRSDDLEVGKVYVTSANLSLRSEQPRNDSGYFQSVPSLGVLPTGTSVKMLSAPVLVERPTVSQLWAQVEAGPNVKSTGTSVFTHWNSTAGTGSDARALATSLNDFIRAQGFITFRPDQQSYVGGRPGYPLRLVVYYWKEDQSAATSIRDFANEWLKQNKLEGPTFAVSDQTSLPGPKAPQGSISLELNVK